MGEEGVAGLDSADRDTLAAKYFACNTRERAVFEAGIKLGTVYHQFVGTPLSASNVDGLEKAIEDGVRVQPFVEDVSVRIDRTSLRRKRNEYDYQTLTGPMLDVTVVIRIGRVRVIGQMKYIEELNYPLMFVKEVSGP